MPLAALAQLLWAGQGVTSEEGGRTAPSAGATYPLTLYAVAGKVARLAAGIYRYDPAPHALRLVRRGDVRAELSAAALEQGWIGACPVTIVVAADERRTATRYGERAERYVHVEAGHVAGNICLQAQTLALGTTVVGAFDDEMIARAVRLRTRERPVLLLPVGYTNDAAAPAAMLPGRRGL